MKRVLEFSPATIPHWTTTSAIQAQEQVLLIVKSIYSDVVGSNDPQTAKYGLFLSLYSDDGVVEIFIAEKDYTKTSGATQPEINRIVQSLHRIEAKVASATTNSNPFCSPLRKRSSLLALPSCSFVSFVVKELEVSPHDLNQLIKFLVTIQRTHPAHLRGIQQQSHGK